MTVARFRDLRGPNSAVHSQSSDRIERWNEIVGAGHLNLVDSSNTHVLALVLSWSAMLLFDGESARGIMDEYVEDFAICVTCKKVLSFFKLCAH